jgi:hypothetical protein
MKQVRAMGSYLAKYAFSNIRLVLDEFLENVEPTQLRVALFGDQLSAWPQNPGLPHYK